MSRIDLHLHSTYSDGSFSPHQLLSKASHFQVTALSLTDHDTTDGISEAVEAASHLDIEIIPGVEVSSSYQGTETHILGYFIDLQNPLFQDRLRQLRQSRKDRIPKIVKKLNEIGVPLSHEDILSIAGHGSIGRPHVAQALVKKHYVSSIEEAFSQYLKEGAKGYIPRQLPDAQEAIHWIRSAGGVPSLAHPGWVRHSIQELKTVCLTLKKYGLQGIEVFHSSHTSRQISEYQTLANRLDLLVTGGSDFHGKPRPEIEVGIGKGNLNIPGDILEALRTRASENRMAAEETRK
ncbi:MAG: PHP domain-containing protein [Nitrospirales bacterium]|nr:PHP domain-containing protein [Nitrospira sp.]MDR4501968.1 PHP domain-containing protein [Nitrospirales bacterium]